MNYNLFHIPIVWEMLILSGLHLNDLRLLTHVGFFRQNGLILPEVFYGYGKEQESQKKYVITL